MKITRELIFEGRSKRGGWSRRQIVELGIPWPLRPGWIARAIGNEVSAAQVERFLHIRNAHLEPQVDLWPDDVNHLRAIQREDENHVSGVIITGEHYTPDGCTCGLPPWELCQPDCEHAA